MLSPMVCFPLSTPGKAIHKTVFKYFRMLLFGLHESFQIIMAILNKEIAEMLNEKANLIAKRGENQFRVRSYRTAANTIYGLTD